MYRLRKTGFTLVEIMIVVAIIALISAVAIPNLLRARYASQAATAKANMKTIAGAFEMYAAANHGLYPTDEDQLVNPASVPPYLNRSYDHSIVSGYSYLYSITTTSGYDIQTVPKNLSGASLGEIAGGGDCWCYIIRTGGELVEVSCPCL